MHPVSPASDLSQQQHFQQRLQERLTADDIARFEYLKKSARNFGSVLIGIETSHPDNFRSLFAQLDAAAFTYRDITNDDILAEFLI